MGQVPFLSKKKAETTTIHGVRALKKQGTGVLALPSSSPHSGGAGLLSPAVASALAVALPPSGAAPGAPPAHSRPLILL